MNHSKKSCKIDTIVLYLHIFNNAIYTLNTMEHVNTLDQGLTLIKEHLNFVINNFILMEAPKEPEDSPKEVPVKLELLPPVYPFKYDNRIYPLFQISVEGLPLDAYEVIVNYFSNENIPIVGQRFSDPDTINAICVCYGLPKEKTQGARDFLKKLLGSNNS